MLHMHMLVDMLVHMLHTLTLVPMLHTLMLVPMLHTLTLQPMLVVLLHTPSQQPPPLTTLLTQPSPSQSLQSQLRNLNNLSMPMTTSSTATLMGHYQIISDYIQCEEHSRCTMK